MKTAPLTPLEKTLIVIENAIASFRLRPEHNHLSETLATEIDEAHKYLLLMGGKRIRPQLLLLFAGALGGESVLPKSSHCALAVELIHTYSLVHDDLPCLDNDDLRRGHPTTHKKYGEAKGLLVGDGLLTQAFFTLTEMEIPGPEKNGYFKLMVRALSAAAGPEGMIWGQWLDIALAEKENIDWQSIGIIHRNKTGKLLGVCFELGLLCACLYGYQDLDLEQVNTLAEEARLAGIFLGISFQIQDDILDATQSTEKLGKTANKDEKFGKSTTMSLLGQDKAEALRDRYTEEGQRRLKNIFSHPFFFAAGENNIFLNTLKKQIDSLLNRTS